MEENLEEKKEQPRRRKVLWDKSTENEVNFLLAWRNIGYVTQNPKETKDEIPAVIGDKVRMRTKLLRQSKIKHWELNWCLEDATEVESKGGGTWLLVNNALTKVGDAKLFSMNYLYT